MMSTRVSTRKGSTPKNGQRYQNTKAYKVCMYGESRQAKLAKALPLTGLCDRCKEKIEWKRKYGKYKPLSVPKKCTNCFQKKVNQAYYLLCHDCASMKQVCAKCVKTPVFITSQDMVEVPEELQKPDQVDAISEDETAVISGSEGADNPDQSSSDEKDC